jgi:hypothetical protein
MVVKNHLHSSSDVHKSVSGTLRITASWYEGQLDNENTSLII